LLALLACSSKPQEPAKPPPRTIRVAVIGGMLETGFWQAVAARFEQATGHKVELASSGPKPVVIRDFRTKGDIDLITMHANDAIVNLVVDGLAADPQPWVQNDLVIVGPSADPAGIRGEKDAGVALKKLVAANAKVVVNASLGADSVLHDLEHDAGTKLPDASLIVFGGDSQRQILARAAEANAYTFVGRIPVLTGKLKHEGIEVMVRGDVRLRRPYLVAVANHGGDPSRIAAARELAAFLRAPATQEFVASFGKGKYDAEPLFFPVVVR
jgi:tungstate transport system substrate-binding protein